MKTKFEKGDVVYHNKSNRLLIWYEDCIFGIPLRNGMSACIHREDFYGLYVDKFSDNNLTLISKADFK